MKKSVLIGISILTVLAILLAAVALGFTDAKTKFNAFKSAEAANVYDPITIIEPDNEAQTNLSFRIIDLDENEAVQQAQSNVSFRIIEPMYIPDDYKFENAAGTKFVGVMNGIETASLSFKK